MSTTVVWVAAGLAITPVLLLLAARAPSTLLMLVIPTEVLLGGMERGAGVPGLRVGEIALAVFMAFLILSPAWRLKRLRHHPMNRWMVLLFVGGFLVPLASWRFRGHVFNAEALQAYAAVAKALAIYVTVAPLQLSPSDAERVLRASVWAVVASAAVAILQVLHFSPIESLLVQYFKGPHLYERLAGLSNRATGLAANWHSLGIQFVMAIVLAWLLRSRTPGSQRMQFIVVAILVAGLWTVRTLTAAFVLCLLAGLGLWERSARVRRRWALRLGIVALVGVAAAAIAVASSSSRGAYFATLIPATLYVRAYYWMFLYLPVIREHLIFGYGPFMPVVNAQSDDSQVILFLLRGGIVGLATWTLVLWQIALWGRRAMRDGSGLTVLLGRAVVVFTGALSIASLMQSFLTYTGVVEFYWVTVGMLASQYPAESVGSSTPSVGERDQGGDGRQVVPRG
jgi:hypothetical protein